MAVGLLSPSLLSFPATAAALDSPLTQRFTSKEGFTLAYPADWVVAFDRSGGFGNGPVTVS